MKVSTDLYGAIEAGGTKFICAVGDATGRVLAHTRIPTREPTSTFAEVLDFFRATQAELGMLGGFGLAAFGPLELDPASPKFGHTLMTPKLGWSDIDLRGALLREFGRPVGINTDVNAAGLAELRWGADSAIPSLAYVTVGTGIGGGVIYKQAPLVGLTHAEIGHVYVRRHAEDRNFPGVCPFHGDCVEGLASGPAIFARAGRSLEEATEDDPVWDMEADYLGQLCAHLVNTVAPHRILLGGGVMQQQRLFPAIRARMRHWLGGYCQRPEVTTDNYITPPVLGALAGVKGALALAIDAVQEERGL
jgi:fructokinase